MTCDESCHYYPDKVIKSRTREVEMILVEFSMTAIYCMKNNHEWDAMVRRLGQACCTDNCSTAMHDARMAPSAQVVIADRCSTYLITRHIWLAVGNLLPPLPSLQTNSSLIESVVHFAQVLYKLTVYVNRMCNV